MVVLDVGIFEDLQQVARRRDITIQELLRAMSFLIGSTALSSKNLDGPDFL